MMMQAAVFLPLPWFLALDPDTPRGEGAQRNLGIVVVPTCTHMEVVYRETKSPKTFLLLVRTVCLGYGCCDYGYLC